MSRRLVRLTRDRLADLGELGAEQMPCRTCVRWELDPVRRDRLAPTEAVAMKDAWLTTVLREWGSCGRVLLVDDVPAGYALYAPAAFVPGAAAHPTAPVSPDAVLLVALRVSRRHEGAGLGRVLVQGAAADLVGRVRALEAFASSSPTAAPGCLLPSDFLTAVGFRTHRPHPRTPRLRMDLRTAITWRGEVEAAVERLVGVVRPRPTPAPASRAELS